MRLAIFHKVTLTTLTIKGRIDRIDFDTLNQQFMIFDYKWSKKHSEEQLALQSLQHTFYNLLLQDYQKSPEVAKQLTRAQKFNLNIGASAAADAQADQCAIVPSQFIYLKEAQNNYLSTEYTQEQHEQNLAFLASIPQMRTFHAQAGRHCDHCCYRYMCGAFNACEMEEATPQTQED